MNVRLVHLLGATCKLMIGVSSSIVVLILDEVSNNNHGCATSISLDSLKLADSFSLAGFLIRMHSGTGANDCGPPLCFWWLEGPQPNDKTC